MTTGPPGKAIHGQYPAERGEAALDVRQAGLAQRARSLGTVVGYIDTQHPVRVPDVNRRAARCRTARVRISRTAK
jgi:hypothetical protein